MTYSATVLADSPSVYYRLGDSAAPAVPTSGLGVNAAMTGTVTFGQPGALAGDADTAVSFPGGLNYLQTASSPGAAYDFGDGPMSIEFWYKTSATGTLQNAVSKGTNGYIARLQTTNKWIFRKSGATDILVTTATFTDTAAWHHFVATRNGTGSANTHIYVDGVDQAGTYTEPATGIANTVTGFGIGVDSAAVGTGPWTGLLDEVALYPSVLSQAQVLAHFAAGQAQLAGGAAQPGRTWLRRFRHRQYLPPPFTAAAAAASAAAPLQRPQIPGRAAGRARLGGRGLCAAGILATGIGPPAVPAPHQPPAIAHPAPHPAQWRGGQGSPPAARPQPSRPLTIYQRPGRRALWRGGTGPAAAVTPGTGTLQPSRPVTVYRRSPHAALWRAGRGAPPAAQAQPSRPLTVFARPLHRALWRGNAGTTVTVTPGTGSLQPLRPATVYRRTPHAALWRAGRGVPPAAKRQPFSPVTVYRRIAHRVLWRAGAGSPAGPPPPSTIGILTGRDDPQGALTGTSAATGALAGRDAATGALTAIDSKTGGPG